MEWAFLAGAILSEVSATTALRASVHGSWKWYAPVVVGYVLSFILLSFALRDGLGLGIAYGVWSASGVCVTAVLSKLVFKEPLTLLMMLGMVLIVGGVLLVELCA